MLIKLCDQANDDGECWPSHASIAEACEISKRSVINHINELEKLGILTIKARFTDGRQSSNIYQIAKNLGVHDLHGGVQEIHSGGAADSPQGCRRFTGGGAGAAHRISHLEPTNEPIIEPKKNIQKKIAFDFANWPTPPSEQVWADYLAMRKAKKAPVTQTVINRLGNVLTQCAMNGFTVDDCLSLAIMRNWQGLELDWVLKNSGQIPGAHPPRPQQPTYKNSRERNAERFRETLDYAMGTDFADPHCE